MTEDIEITFARRLGEVLGEMRGVLDEKAIKRVLTFIMARHGIDIINNAFWVDARPRTISAQAVSAPPPAPADSIVFKTTPVKTFDVVMEVKEPTKTFSCPICHKNGFEKANGVAGHMWAKHKVRRSEYQEARAG